MPFPYDMVRLALLAYMESAPTRLTLTPRQRFLIFNAPLKANALVEGLEGVVFYE